METVYNIFALRQIAPGRSEVAALWDGTDWTTDPEKTKNYWSFDDALDALDFLKAEGMHRGFDAVDVFDFEHREPSERKRWNPGRSLSGYTQQEALKLLNTVRSALANLDMNDKNPAIRAALTIGWVESEEIQKGPMVKKRWGQMEPDEVREMLEGMLDELAQGDPDGKSDIVTLGLDVVARAIESVKKSLPVPDHSFLRKLAIEDFVSEHGRQPKLGWWEDPLSTEHPV